MCFISIQNRKHIISISIYEDRDETFNALPEILEIPESAKVLPAVITARMGSYPCIRDILITQKNA